jgi:tRNA (Thr-GGU) A37 N-methylase
MEATCFSDTSVDSRRTAKRYIPEYRTLFWEEEGVFKTRSVSRPYTVGWYDD